MIILYRLNQAKNTTQGYSMFKSHNFFKMLSLNDILFSYVQNLCWSFHVYVIIMRYCSSHIKPFGVMKEPLVMSRKNPLWI